MNFVTLALLPLTRSSNACAKLSCAIVVQIFAPQKYTQIREDEQAISMAEENVFSAVSIANADARPPCVQRAEPAGGGAAEVIPGQNPGMKEQARSDGHEHCPERYGGVNTESQSAAGFFQWQISQKTTSIAVSHAIYSDGKTGQRFLELLHAPQSTREMQLPAISLCARERIIRHLRWFWLLHRSLQGH